MRRIVVAAVVCFALVAVAGAVTMVPPSQDKPAQQVEVVNFPAVQSVVGTVTVGNLPAVQTVTGSVQVSNLPLDANGNLKVSAPQSGPSYQWIKIADGVALSYNVEQVVGIVDVAGWRKADFVVRARDNSSRVGCWVEYGADGVFGIHQGDGVGGTESAIVSTEVHGPQARVIAYSQTTDAVVDIAVYLSN
jgi:hypothetical protein